MDVGVVAGNHERILPDGVKCLCTLCARLSPRFFDVGAPRDAGRSLFERITNSLEGFKASGLCAHR